MSNITSQTNRYLQVQSAGDILFNTFSIFIAYYPTLILTFLFPIIPSYVIQFSRIVSSPSGNLFNSFNGSLLIIFFFLTCYARAATIFAIAEIIRDRQPSVKGSFRNVGVFTPLRLGVATALMFVISFLTLCIPGIVIGTVLGMQLGINRTLITTLAYFIAVATLGLAILIGPVIILESNKFIDSVKSIIPQNKIMILRNLALLSLFLSPIFIMGIIFNNAPFQMPTWIRLFVMSVQYLVSPLLEIANVLIYFDGKARAIDKLNLASDLKLTNNPSEIHGEE